MRGLHSLSHPDWLSDGQTTQASQPESSLGLQCHEIVSFSGITNWLVKVTLEMRVAVLAAMGSQSENEGNYTRKPSPKRDGKLLIIPLVSLDAAIPEARDPFGLLNCASQ